MTATPTMKLSSLPNPLSLVEYKNYRFLIFDAPTEANLDLYIKEFKKYNVHHLVRACDPTYTAEKLNKEDIDVHEMPFPDGGAPSETIIQEWLSVCKHAFKNSSNNETIGVHCVAGLGRAPVLVAVALIELGLNYDEAVELIRQKRRGAINAKQLKFLKSYVPHKKCTII